MSAKGQKRTFAWILLIDAHCVRIISASLRHRVPPRGLTEERRAQLRHAFLRLEVNIDQPEAVAVAINPFEVVLCAPVEVPIHRYAVGGRTLELCEAGAQEHDPVGVV